MGLLEDIQATQLRILEELSALRVIKNAAAVEREGFIDLKAAAELFHCSTSTLRDKCADRKVPCYQEGPGMPYLFRRSEVLDFIATHRNTTTEESAKTTLKKVHARRS